MKTWLQGGGRCFEILLELSFRLVAHVVDATPDRTSSAARGLAAVLGGK